MSPVTSSYRYCYKLPYMSQHESDTERITSQLHKIGERIFEYYEYGKGYGKKKGMHWKPLTGFMLDMSS
ncbi:hypothetical protein [Oceanicoccus sp. KOV_DT_Chl]|uniref:hypothetical protein n=1 Tax=Oceanicoccus sp. KOV_DT_Chl TaxID=1904639 RepID=UPI0011AFB02E|nr:hypothetical protein [Oceanicoccus sp. KOV_DT_Chl]